MGSQQVDWQFPDNNKNNNKLLLLLLFFFWWTDKLLSTPVQTMSVLSQANNNNYLQGTSGLCAWTVFLVYWAVQWSWFARVNAPCNLSCKKSWEVAVSLPGWFLSRRCFTLCITMEVEPRIVKQYTVADAKITGERKSLCIVVWFTRRSRVRGRKKKMHFGASYSMSNNLLLDARHILSMGLKKTL